ncbi:MAG: DNA translocase FtsK [Butyrivibrio sp.]|nr:DNA translocase FtsK [Butyrivibrio sp.]
MATKRGNSNKKRTYNRKSSSNSKARTRNRRSESQEPLDYELKSEILMILILAATVFLFFCNFHVCGSFGNAISDYMFGLFGLVAYIVPVVIMGACAVLISNSSSKAAVRKVISGIIIIYMISIMAEIFAGRIDTESVLDVLGIFDGAKNGRNGGGVFGGVVAYLLIKNLSFAGTLIVIFVISLISIVIFTEKSFINGVKRGGRKVIERTREDAAEYREFAHQRRLEIEERRQMEEEERRLELEQMEDEKILRMDKKISGVMLDTELKPEEFNEPSEPEQEIVNENSAYEDEEIFIPDKEEIHDDIHEIFVKKGMVTDVEPDGQRVIRTSPVIHTYQNEDDSEALEMDNHEEEQTIKEIKSENPADDSDVTNSDSDIFEPDIVERYDNNIADEEEFEPDFTYEEDIEEEECDEEARQILEQLKQRPVARLKESEDYNNIQIHSEDNTTEYNDGYKVHSQDHIRMTNTSQKIDNRNTNADIVEEKIKMGISPSAPNAPTAHEEMEQSIKKAEKKVPKKYIFPPLSLLAKGEKKGGDSAATLKDTAVKLQNTLKTFGVNVKVTDISQGPAVTRYELQPEAGVKISKIVGLSDDIKMNLAATDIRIEAPIPGKAAVGIEVPNKENSMVALRDLLSSNEFKNFDSNLAFAVGKDIAGKVVVADLGKMPHLLIAGATGSGKSVCINTLIMSLIYKSSPEQVKMIMIDPKVVELSIYNGIPHLLIPVVTDPKKAAAALNWAVVEMNKRYKMFADTGVRDMKGYNKYVESSGDETLDKMPHIVVIVDELADLMMVSSNEVEESICRLTQLARAAGIHLIIATQRPSVDVITGLIKANMPSRIAFAVSSGVDSRTILDTYGAEKLLGKGDMLFAPQGYPKPARVQGAFVSDKEVQDITDFLKKQMDDSDYDNDIQQHIENAAVSTAQASGGGASAGSDKDEYFVEAGTFIIDKEKASIGMLQRAFKIGFNRAARIMDQLCEAGVVGEEEGTKPRKILMTKEEFLELVSEK